MKAITAVCPTGGSAVANGRVSRTAREGENAEIQMYISKLKDLVPIIPKRKRLSKLEVIQYVIDYICELQSALETNPAAGEFDATAALNGLQMENQQFQTNQLPVQPHSPRQPLGVRPNPNTVVCPQQSQPQYNSTDLISTNIHTVIITNNFYKFK